MTETKFRFNERRHDNDRGCESMQGPIIVKNIHSNSKPPSIVTGESIKTHFDPRYGDTSDLRGIRIVGHQEYSEEFAHRGKMYLPGKDTGYAKFSPSVRQYHGIANMPSEPTTQISQHWTGKTRVSPGESDLYEIESIMNRKQRLLSHEQQRNDIPTSNKGDKYYREADRERDFYKKGGLIPGSCIALRESGKVELRKKESGNMGSTSKRSTLSFTEKRQRELLNSELLQLKELNNCSERLGQEVPSWEKKTGQYLVKPEDENY